jgi:putative component of toxin-antitoxin plasmid stabilization module
VIEIRETTVFSEWLASLRDAQARTRIQARILRLKLDKPWRHQTRWRGRF